MRKGKMINELLKAGIRKTSSGKRFHEVKTYEIINLYYEVFGA